MSNIKMMTMIAMITPEEVHIDTLKEALEEHTINPSKDTQNKLAFACHMFVIKHATRNQSVEEIMNEMDQQESRSKLFTKMNPN